MTGLRESWRPPTQEVTRSRLDGIQLLRAALGERLPGQTLRPFDAAVRLGALLILLVLCMFERDTGGIHLGVESLRQLVSVLCPSLGCDSRNSPHVLDQ
ncbi:MAG: hypothetical protein WKF73_05700 [Nocardioidaceae bacterium]